MGYSDKFRYYTPPRVRRGREGDGDVKMNALYGSLIFLFDVKHEMLPEQTELTSLIPQL